MQRQKVASLVLVGILVLSVLFFSVSIGGVNAYQSETDEEKMIGAWELVKSIDEDGEEEYMEEDEEFLWTFYENKSLEVYLRWTSDNETQESTTWNNWEIDEDTKNLTIYDDDEDPKDGTQYNYSFSGDGDTLTLVGPWIFIDEIELIFERAEEDDIIDNLRDMPGFTGILLFLAFTTAGVIYHKKM